MLAQVYEKCEAGKFFTFFFYPLGGSRKISSIYYTDGSKIPRRSRQLVWRAAVEASKNVSQLALQVSYRYHFLIKYSCFAFSYFNFIDLIILKFVFLNLFRKE